MTVGTHIKRVKVYENRFARYYGLTINQDQRKFSAWDCVIPDTNKRIEFKSDFMAAKTGNHFVEFRYSNNDGQSWDESGLTLAKDQAVYWVVYTGEEPDQYMWFLTSDLWELVSNGSFDIKGIRRNLYGNSGSIRCEGWIVPLSILKAIEIEAPIEPMNIIELW